MGLFDNFRKQKPMTQTSDAKKPETIEYDTVDIEKKFRQVASSPAAKSINERVRESAVDFEKQLTKEKFDKLYGNIATFKNDLMFEESGLIVSMNQQLRKRYNALLSSGFLDETRKKYLFLPYLLEKEALGIISDKERMELDRLKKVNNLPKAYQTSVMMYQMLGLGDLEDSNFFPKSFEKYGNMSQYNTPQLIEASRKKLSEVADYMYSELGLDDNKNTKGSR